MASCVAFGCKYRIGPKSKTQLLEEKTKKITFHRFPKNEVRRKEWIQAVRRKGWKPSEYSRLCSSHFSDECFDRTSLRYVRLREDAVPTLFKVHFTGDQFERNRQDGRKLLKQSAIPTVFTFLGTSDTSTSKLDPPEKRALEVAVNADNYGKNVTLKESLEDILDPDEILDLKRNISRLKAQKHFDENQWERNRVDGKKKLKGNAIPTIFENVVTEQRKGKRKRKELKTDEDEVIEFIESLEAKKRLPHCVVCSRPLGNSKKESLSTLTSTSGLSLHHFLMGISGDKPTKIKDCTADDMVCYYCAHLINYADALEAELVKLKGAINGCLEIGSMDEEDKEMLKSEFEVHVAVLDEFSERVVGPGSAAERETLLHESTDSGLSGIVIENVRSISRTQEQGHVNRGARGVHDRPIDRSEQAEDRVKDSSEIQNPDERERLKVDPPVYQCQICKLKTPSRSVLIFHLRRHMADYQWCDFCDFMIYDDTKPGLGSIESTPT